MESSSNNNDNKKLLMTQIKWDWTITGNWMQFLDDVLLLDVTAMEIHLECHAFAGYTQDLNDLRPFRRALD